MSIHDGWVIDPKNTIVIIPCKESGSLSPKLVKYVFQRFPEENVVLNTSTLSLIEMRNRTILDIPLKLMRRFEHFVLFDDDLHPDHRTDDMFRLSADVVGCRFVARSESAWQMPDDVHNSAIRFRRQVVEAMTQPYYKEQFNEQLTERVACECSWFRDQAKTLGFSIARAGFAEHGNQGRWHG